jgi:NAD(P)-dependent dehydrogenase (short-subunit alcohol dehydrogenase family)
MPGRLDDKRIIVTGASRGLGRAIAEAFASEGARLILTATRDEHLRSVLASCRDRGADAAGVVLDLGDPAGARASAEIGVAELGRVDVLVNNAGALGTRDPLADYPLETFREVVEIGVSGTLAVIQAVVPAMSRGSAIINVSSGAAGRAGWGAYSVAKAALEAMTAMLRTELADREIRVVAVNPGGMRTGMRAAAYPREDPNTLPHPSARVEPFIAIAEGADPGPRINAAEWT